MMFIGNNWVVLLEVGLVVALAMYLGLLWAVYSIPDEYCRLPHHVAHGSLKKHLKFMKESQEKDLLKESSHKHRSRK